ncbi:class I SAM-dependent methyltransferase [Desulfovibrio sp. DV]|uniref:class I SAM-dependent methyltransferase n=1 Tax=Desulfovibrio sp. DV TaxID=1844708 RepID=UPI00111516A1|nr:class I SAM-dependent methyltransferase [Desulfovibrio sp. DV]
MMEINALEYYSREFPSTMNALTIFKDTWLTDFALPDFATGEMKLLVDHRILGFEKNLGSFSGLDILELGPMEAAHSKMMLDRGASSVTSIESNRLNFLKCLIIKNLFRLDRLNLLYGDFSLFLEKRSKKYDFCLASGVLYHLADPVSVLSHILNIADSVGIWTHYFDPDLYSEREDLRALMGTKFEIEPKIVKHNGIDLYLQKKLYTDQVKHDNYIGGTHPYSYWFHKNSLFEMIRCSGCEIVKAVEVATPEPSVTLYVARKKESACGAAQSAGSVTVQGV